MLFRIKLLVSFWAPYEELKTLCGENTKDFNVESCGIYSYRFTLNGEGPSPSLQQVLDPRRITEYSLGDSEGNMRCKDCTKPSPLPRPDKY